MRLASDCRLPERMHGDHHSNLGFAQVEQELEFRICFIEQCDRSSSLFTRSLCGLAAPFYRSLSLSNLLSAKVVERPSSAIYPSEKWYFSFAHHDYHHLCCHSATIESVRLVVKGRLPCIVPLSWHAREGQESDCDSFHGSLCPNRPLKNTTITKFLLTEEVLTS